MATTNEVVIDELPIELNLPPIVAGADYEFSLQILDDNDAAQDTTGWDMTIKGRATDVNGEVVFTLTVGSGITHTPAQGKFDIKITDTVSASLNIPYVSWDCKITDADGDITYPFEGVFKVKQPVTR